MKIILMLVSIQGGLPYAEPIGSYADAPTCVEASIDYNDDGVFAVCVPTDSVSEREVVDYMAHELGLKEGDF